MIGERNSLNMKLLIKKEAELRDLENSQPGPIEKNERVWPSGSVMER